MKKLIAIGILALISTAAFALPQGKPFQEIQAAIDVLAGSVVDIEGRVAALETQLVVLQDDVDTNADAIAAIEDELVILNSQLQLKQDILDGNCPAGFALQAIDPAGQITCIATGSNVSVTVISSFNYISPNTSRTTHVQCPSGTIPMGIFADYVGGIRGTQIATNRRVGVINNPAPFAAFVVASVTCLAQ